MLKNKGTLWHHHIFYGFFADVQYGEDIVRAVFCSCLVSDRPSSIGTKSPIHTPIKHGSWNMVHLKSQVPCNKPFFWSAGQSMFQVLMTCPNFKRGGARLGQTGPRVAGSSFHLCGVLSSKTGYLVWTSSFFWFYHVLPNCNGLIDHLRGVRVYPNLRLQAHPHLQIGASQTAFAACTSPPHQPCGDKAGRKWEGYAAANFKVDIGTPKQIQTRFRHSLSSLVMMILLFSLFGAPMDWCNLKFLLEIHAFKTGQLCVCVLSVGRGNNKNGKIANKPSKLNTTCLLTRKTYQAVHQLNLHPRYAPQQDLASKVSNLLTIVEWWLPVEFSFVKLIWDPHVAW